MPYNTWNPIPSSDAKDLSDNAENIDNSVNTALDTWTDRLGVERRTIQGQLKLLGYTAPDVYASGLVFTVADNMATIERNKIIYAPLPSAIPFTTSGTWTADDENKFFVVQRVPTESNEIITRIQYTTGILADTTSPAKFESDYYDSNKVNGSGSTWIKTGNTGAPSTSDFDNAVLYNSNGDEYKLEFDGLINAAWFGAIPDYFNITPTTRTENPSFTDNTAAYQSAINALPNGGVVESPRGGCAVTNLTTTGRYQNITFSGAGREVSAIVGVGAAGSWVITSKFEDDYFGAIGLKDISIQGREGTYDVNGISTEFVLGNEFSNIEFKYLDTCHRGINCYQGNYENIRLWQYNIGFRGLTSAEGIATGQDPNAVPMAECLFSSVYFYGGNTTAPGAKAIVSDVGMNGCTLIMCTFAGNTLHRAEFGVGFTLYKCRFERMAANTTWVSLGSNNKLYGCEVFTDGGNCWWTPSDPHADNWCFVIQGDGNLIDGFSPEFPRRLVKLEGGSSNNDVKWIPDNLSAWNNTTWFYNPIQDEGTNNVVRVGNYDKTIGRTNPETKVPVLNELVGTNDQTCFTVIEATQTSTPTVISKGPYKNEAVYSYDTPTGNRLIYGSPTGLTVGAWYCFSAWIAFDDLANIDTVEIFLGEDIFVGENFARVQLFSDLKWVRVFKMFKTTTNTVNCGFRMPSGTTGTLYISQPQLTYCGTDQANLLVGGYVPTYGAITSASNPSKLTAYNLVDKSGERALGNTYTNNSEKEINVYVSTRNTASSQAVRVEVNGVNTLAFLQANANFDFPLSFSVKPGETYRVYWSAGTGSITTWRENI